VFSDITVGDPHGIKGIDRKGGESVVIVRTETGRNILHAARSDGSVQLRKVPYEDIIKGQKIGQKKRDWRGYAEAWKVSGREYPDFDIRIPEQSVKPGQIGTYRESLDLAFRLDEFAAPGELFDLVTEQLKRKKRKNLLSLPLRVMKRVFKGLGV